MKKSFIKTNYRTIFSILAVCLSGILFAFLIHRSGNISELVELLKSAGKHIGYLLLGVVLFCISLLCGIVRWFILIRALKLPITFPETLHLYASGHFFNVVSPGSTGGDVAKSAWLAVKYPNYRTRAITSIAAERLIGLYAMLVFIAVVSFFNRDFFNNHKIMLALINVVYALVVVCFLTGIFLIKAEFVKTTFKSYEEKKKSRFLNILLKAWEALRICLTHPVAFTGAFSLSLLNHFVDVCCYYAISRSLSLTVNLRELATITPISNLISTIPATPGGAGIRENALQFLMDIINVPRTESTALGLLMFGVIIFWALIAGVIMVFGVISQSGKTGVPENGRTTLNN